MKYSIKAPTIQGIVGQMTDQIHHEMERRSFLAANELRNAAQLVLRGQRSGRRYKVPGTYREQREVVGTYTTKNGKVRNKTKGTGVYEYHKYKRGVHYTASAPGEPPAVRTGAFRMSWQPTARAAFGSYISKIESDIRVGKKGQALGEILEEGTSRMAPRPYQDAILKKAETPIKKIYNEPYF